MNIVHSIQELQKSTKQNLKKKNIDKDKGYTASEWIQQKICLFTLLIIR